VASARLRACGHTIYDAPFADALTAIVAADDSGISSGTLHATHLHYRRRSNARRLVDSQPPHHTLPARATQTDAGWPPRSLAVPPVLRSFTPRARPTAQRSDDRPARGHPRHPRQPAFTTHSQSAMGHPRQARSSVRLALSQTRACHSHSSQSQSRCLLS
jgi:hypothetical protein